ncbi:hypothetical protein SynROS8604_01234 [Synechococcus sp. ROS8604]|nr:hypothetical protein SynROS8604_01234 [Synechococcus sp. ROS8604]
MHPESRRADVVTINICATRMIVRLVVHLSWLYFNHLPALMGMF